MRRLSKAQARRVTIAAQGFARARSTGPVTMRQVQGEIDRLAQFQIDTISVVQRAHYFPLFSRLGGYDTALLDRAMNRAPRRLFEYWGHAACLVDTRLAPALRSRMLAHETRYAETLTKVEAAHPGLGEHVMQTVTALGPLTARQIEHQEERERDHWGWNWSAVKTVLEYQFGAGALSSAGRNSSFERRYDLFSRVLPSEHQHTEWDDVRQRRELLARAGRSLGVFTLTWLTDYFYLRRDSLVEQALRDLVAEGLFLPVEIEGIAKPAWLWHEATVPRSVSAQALISPFDSMMFQRERLESLFDFDYRIEIYVPEPKRRFGYYVYSLLLGDRFAARVDLKAVRASGVLEVKSTWFESHVGDPEHVAGALATELRLLADWLALADIAVLDRGDAAAHLGCALTKITT